MRYQSFIPTKVKLRQDPIIHVAQPHLICISSGSCWMISAHDTLHNLLGRTLMPMTFLNGIDGKLAPLLQSTRLAALDLQSSDICNKSRLTKSKTDHISSIRFCMRVPVRAKQLVH